LIFAAFPPFAALTFTTFPPFAASTFYAFPPLQASTFFTFPPLPNILTNQKKVIFLFFKPKTLIRLI